MTPEQSKAEKGWRLARAVAEIAYIYQAELQSNKSSTDIEEVFVEIETLLKRNKEKWEESQSQILEVQAVSNLTEIIRGISSGEIFNNMTEVQVQMKIWQTLFHTQGTNPDDYNEAIKIPLPTKEEIADSKKGPKEFALAFWEDFEGHKRRTTVIEYGRKVRAGKLTFTPLRSVKTILERDEYIASVCVNLLQLQTDELKWIAEGVQEMFSKD